MIGDAIETINPYELTTYFALLYQMITLSDIIDQNQYIKFNKPHFILKLKWPCGYTQSDALPLCKAPTSAVKLWIKYTKLMDRKHLYNFYKIGYRSTNELQGCLIGYYKFWSVER